VINVDPFYVQGKHVFVFFFIHYDYVFSAYS